jgi:hypothetical protein
MKILGKNRQDKCHLLAIEKIDGVVFLNTYDSKGLLSDFDILVESIELDDNRMLILIEEYNKIK